MDRQTKNFAKELCGSSAVPSIILGNDMLCKFCNTDDFVSAGVHFSSLIVSDMDFILGKTSKTMVKIKDRIYCAVVTAVNNECYFCQLFDSEEVFSMAQLTDVYDNTIPAVLANGSQVDSVVNKLNRLVSEPSVKKNNKLCTELLEIINESGKAKNKLEELLLYCKLCFSKIGCSLFNLSLYVKWTIDKCNSFLLKSGRCIESLCMDEDLTVNAEYKYVVFSVIEMIQFSLLYSPIDVNPIVALAKNKGNIELTVTSRSSVFIPKGEEYEFLGSFTGNLAIAKRSAQRCGAGFQFINENSNVIGIKIVFPQAEIQNHNGLVFESVEVIDYNDEFSKFAFYKMQVVIDAINIQRS